MNFVRVKEKSNNYTVAFFLYATLIVDLIRKIGWGNVKIGKHCVIGANSVVTKDVPDYCVAVGSPARVIKKM